MAGVVVRTVRMIPKGYATRENRFCSSYAPMSPGRPTTASPLRVFSDTICDSSKETVELALTIDEETQ